MAFSDRWTLSTIRAACQRELGDPNARFWSTAELDLYIGDWQTELQDKFSFVMDTATQTMVGSSTILLATLTDIMRVDALYYNNRRLPGRTKQDLEEITRNWRSTDNIDPEPVLTYQNDSRDIVLWPPVSGTGTVVMEYAKVLGFATNTSTMSVPAWTRYSAIPYVVMRALLREGPANSPNKALYYKKRFERWTKLFRVMWDGYLPIRAPRLQPGMRYEERIINPRRRVSDTYE